MQNFVSIFFLIIVKYIEGLLIAKISINRDRGEIVLRRTLGKITISKDNVVEWGYRTILTIETSPTNMKFLEFTLSDGKKVIYPIYRLRKGLLTLSEKDTLIKVLGKKPKQYSKIYSVRNLKSLKYEAVYLWL